MNYKKSKIFLIATLVATTLLSCSDSNKKQNANKQNWINFDWVGDSISNKYYEKIAITIPFSIEGIPHQFNSQFDLGATSTMVYGNSIKPYLIKYQELGKKLDTINKTHWLQSQKVGAFKDISFKLDTVLFQNQELVHFEGYGDELTIDSIETKTIKHIGTIGPNLFQNKYLVIDFPNHRMVVLDSLSVDYIKRANFVDAKLDDGRIKVPVTINDRTEYFMFDTGSSLFPLVVSKKSIQNISIANKAVDTLNISTWGEYYDVHGYNMTSKISIGDSKVNTDNFKVYDSKKEFDQFYENEGIMGIMGNSFFLEKKIIIDYKNKRFGIID